MKSKTMTQIPARISQEYKYVPITTTNWKYGSFLLTGWRHYQNNLSNLNFWKIPAPFSTIVYHTAGMLSLPFVFLEILLTFLLHEELFPLA